MVIKQDIFLQHEIIFGMYWYSNSDVFSSCCKKLEHSLNQAGKKLILPTTFFTLLKTPSDSCCTPRLQKQAGPQLPQTNSVQSHCGLHHLRWPT